ncbi:RHS repeat-associated core domain-containing protein [Streptomyces sp. NPDC056485]|uniref:RHS repeat-associated core domain-containing protein n=1 Tax=Streptomyces sp. NPDC056485 TaxID=3345834 RepID=UPI0036B7DC14
MDAPTDATAVFPADSTPASNDGAALAATDYARAQIAYLGASGRAVNQASPGGHIATTESDRFGNIVRELTAANRSVALGLTAEDVNTQADLGIGALSSADRAGVLSTSRTHSEDGARQLEEFGPLRRVDLAEDLKSGSTVLVTAGTSVLARPWKVNTYDEGRPTDGSAKVKGLITKITAGAQVRDHQDVQGDPISTQQVYNWQTAAQTQLVKDPAGLALTNSTEYDASGRITKEIQPGGTATSATTRVTTYWSATGTGACNGRPEWAGLLCSTAPGGAVTGGGSNPTALPTTTTEYDWFGNPAKVTENSGATVRTTTTTTDAAGRAQKVAITGGLGQTVPETTLEYSSTTGRNTKTTIAGAAISKVFDKLGRQTSYTDADGATTNTEYDLLDRPVKESDSTPSTTTFTYNHATEPRGLPTTTTDSVAGAFSASYDANGQLSAERLPGGYSLRISTDPSGATGQRAYTRDSDGAQVYTSNVTRTIHGQAATDAGWTDRHYHYDRVGRLSSVEETADTICTSRTYGFSNRTNRTSKTVASATPGADCPTTGGTTTTSTYDSADRLVDPGYSYDAFGRTTATPGVTLEYYANDLVRRQTANGKRQTWDLDPALRFRSWTVETDDAGTWTQTQARRNHYGDDSDNPRWIEENTTGAITRNVQSTDGRLAALTNATGAVVLQLANVHGDIALQLPLDTAIAPNAITSDEYGNGTGPVQNARYAWLGTEQRASAEISDLSLMGARLYSPSQGRFMSTDPIPGGNANAYEYCHADPVNCTDLSGMWSYSTWSRWWSPYRQIVIYLNKYETRWAAAGSGSVGQLLGVIEKWVPGWGKILVGYMRLYVWYIASVASYASVRGHCLRIHAWMAGNFYGAPSAWSGYC